MLVPVIRRIKENNKCLIERVFPVEGNWKVKVGDFAEPFSPLGDCRFSQNKMEFPEEFKPNEFKNSKKYYYSGYLLGKVKKEKILAPYDGNLFQDENGKFIFQENERGYALLSGVWGNVKSIYENKSVLMETQTKDILFCASTPYHTSGELVVFPNPSDILKKSYLENFIKGVRGKIIYIGHFAGLDVVKRAYELGASALVAGSTHSEVFDYAKSNNFPFGIFSGFGKIKTPEDIYKFLSSISYRYVFFEGGKNLLRIPVRAEDITGITTITKNKNESDILKKEIVKDIEAGMKVQVLQAPYFGWMGKVDRVEESSIFVKFGLSENSVEIRLPNFLIVE
ncbi:hypothetical protein K0B04_04315 [Patescibacteria group bacterium]|nr:hypothetical protein [Patescibacteria group bacterium]